MKLYSLLYISRSLVNPGAGAPEQIARVSRRNNASCGVTGFLYHDADCFVQVLEGLFDDVNAIYAKIQKDPRHEVIRTLRHEQIETRAFGGWNMGMHDGTAEGGLLGKSFGADPLETVTHRDVPALMRFMRDLSIGRTGVLIVPPSDGD